MHNELAGATVAARRVLTIGSELVVVDVVDRVTAAWEAGELTYPPAPG